MCRCKNREQTFKDVVQYERFAYRRCSNVIWCDCREGYTMTQEDIEDAKFLDAADMERIRVTRSRLFAVWPSPNFLPPPHLQLRQAHACSCYPRTRVCAQ